MAIIIKIVELLQVVQQQIELMQKQVEDAKIREEELICHKNEMFEVFMHRILARQKDRAGPVVEQPLPEVRPQPQRPLKEPQVRVEPQRQPQTIALE